MDNLWRWLIYPLAMTNIANWKIAVDIVSIPSNSMVIFHGHVCLPEGKSHELELPVVPFEY